MRKLLLGTAAVAAVGLGVAATSPQAHADLIVAYSIDGGATTTTVISQTLPFAGTATTGGAVGTLANGLVVGTITASTNSPGVPSLADVLSSTLRISNPSAATESVILSISATGFTNPFPPPIDTLNSHIGGTVAVAGAANTMTFRSCLWFDNVSHAACAGADVATNIGTANITAAAAFSDDQIALINSATTPYSMTEVLQLTLTPGSILGFQANTTVTPKIPEPMTLSLLGAGLVGLGVIRRRRRH
jgi:hypothetical protein